MFWVNAPPGGESVLLQHVLKHSTPTEAVSIVRKLVASELYSAARQAVPRDVFFAHDKIPVPEIDLEVESSVYGGWDLPPQNYLELENRYLATLAEDTQSVDNIFKSIESSAEQRASALVSEESGVVIPEMRAFRKEVDSLTASQNPEAWIRSITDTRKRLRDSVQSIQENTAVVKKAIEERRQREIERDKNARTQRAQSSLVRDPVKNLR
jgi:hypothetical protein